MCNPWVSMRTPREDVSMRQGLRGQKSAAGLKNSTLRGLEEIWAPLCAAGESGTAVKTPLGQEQPTLGIRIHCCQISAGF